MFKNLKYNIFVLFEALFEVPKKLNTHKNHTEFEQTILENMMKIWYLDNKFLKWFLSGLVMNELSNFMYDNYIFKQKFPGIMEVGIYDKTEPELYEKILSIYSLDGKEISIFYKSGIWDEDFLKTLDDILEEKETERLKKLIDEKVAEQVKQERIRKMFEKPLDNEKTLD